MQNAMKFEMMYQGRMISSSIVMRAMEYNTERGMNATSRNHFLKNLKHCRFQAGYYDQHKREIYTEIDDFNVIDKDFFIKDNSAYTVIEDKSNHLGVHYIVLKENELFKSVQQLRIKIIGYLVFSFILMGIVGYFLGRLFLRPVREQIESLDNFISDTTHELNTPISAILMTIQSLKDVEPKKLKRLEASAKRLSVMYSSLTYRLEGKVESSELLYFASIVEERVEYVKELINSKHLHITLDLEPTQVFMPKTSSYRLIDNLLSNAIKYSNVGDSIFITLKDNVLKVRDTGIGIDKQAQNDIFKRYHRQNDERGGFGIGLNIVLSICKQYKIKLDLKSEIGEGSTFILTFPKVHHRVL
jgi:two-component system OmpR family sensor kinase